MEAIEVAVFVPSALPNTGPRVKLSKIGVAPNAEMESAKWEEHTAGQSNQVHGKSLPVDYWIEGRLIEPPKAGGYMTVYRTIRNGIKAEGIFSSSEIKKVEGNKIYTANSVYEIEYLK